MTSVGCRSGELYVEWLSVSIAIYSDNGISADGLLRNADAAMYRAKNGGRNAFAFYTPELDLRALERPNGTEDKESDR